MKKTLLLVIAAIISANTWSQNSNVEFFTEDGQKFYVFLNGEKLNDPSQTKVKVNHLNATDFKLRVVFEDENIATIEKNLKLKPNTQTIYHLKHLEGRTETTKSIKKFAGNVKRNFLIKDSIPSETKEIYVLRLVSETSLATQSSSTANYTAKTAPSANTGVKTSTNVTATEQTISQSTSTDQPNQKTSLSMNLNINASGVGVNASVTDHQETTTVTTTTATTTESADHYEMPGYSGPIGCSWPVSDQEFSNVKRSITSKTFEDSKLTVAKQVINSNCLFSHQVKEIMLLFDFEDTRLDLAKYAYGYTYDLGNYYKVNDAFTFESSIDELNNYIQSR